MPSQRITIAKVGGVGGDLLLQRLRKWSEARKTRNANLWSNEQWPKAIRRRADQFAERLRSNAWAPPVVYFVEYSDLWSSGYLFSEFLKTKTDPEPLTVHGDHYEIMAYPLPDKGRLSRRLAKFGRQQWPETDLYIRHLRDALDAWQKIVSQSVVVVLRHVVGGLVMDEEMEAALRTVPNWLKSR